MIDPRFFTLAPPQRLGDIAARFGCDLVPDGAGDEMIVAPAALGESLPGEITFFSDKRRREGLATAKAAACFTTERLSSLVADAGMIPLLTDKPRAHFARLTQSMVREGAHDLSEPNINPTADIHPSAIIADGVTIGARTKIGAHSIIDAGVTIGADCHIHPLVRVSFATLGDHVTVKSSTVIGGAGFGMAEDEDGIFDVPHLGQVLIHNRVHIGSNCCVDRGQLGDTTLCDDVKIDNLVQVGHNVFIDKGAMLAGHAGVSGSCRIGKKAMFGGRAATADHVNVGDGAIVAAFAGVMSDIPDGEMWSGIPAMPIRAHMRSVATLKKLSKK